EFIVGTEANRFDQGSFTLQLTGTDVTSDHVIETNMMGVPGTMNVMNNDGFLMTGMGGRIQFLGEEKLSFTKLAETADMGTNTIKVQNFIERNFDKGAISGGDFVTSPEDDGAVDWQEGDQIVIASSSYDYKEEDVRIITGVLDNGDGTTTLTLDSALTYRHYGATETYGQTEDAAPGTTPASQLYTIDMRAEVALLSRNIKVEGLLSQDTDVAFGDRANLETQTRVRAGGLSDAEAAVLPPRQVKNGVGGHIMIMPDSGQIIVDGVQLDRLGQASQKGRYPIHWHLGGDRTGDVLRNSSVTNSNNRGVTIHGTDNLLIEGVVLHDIHGHGFFFEDAVETGNQLIGNIAFGIHLVGGSPDYGDKPGINDPFVVDTHDSVRQADSRFKSSAAFWITNPTNTFVGNISAGASGTGFWYAIPRTALGLAAESGDYDGYNPIYAEFGQFDYNTSHSTPVGLNFDRGSDIEDARPSGFPLPGNDSDNYSPRVGGVASGAPVTNVLHGFTSYKATDSGFYHRGQGDTIHLSEARFADSYNTVWAVSETSYDNNLFVGHSLGNADQSAPVGGPRLYDGAGLYTGSHFAGFGGENAHAFEVEGSSFGPTMYHAFRETSFRDDGTYNNLSHAVSDFPDRNERKLEHDLGQPVRWIKGALDLDGTLTSAAGGGAGFSIVPSVDYLADADDTQPLNWDAFLTDDIYARIRVENLDDGVALFPTEETGEPLVRFTEADGDFIDVMGGQQINEQFYWTQIAAKADTDEDGNGFVENTFTVEFMRDGLPTGGFIVNMDNQDGGRPDLVPAIKERVDRARIVTKFVGAGNYTPEFVLWNQPPGDVTEVFTETDLRSASDEVVYFRDDAGNLLLNTAIKDQNKIRLVPGDPLQTAYVNRKVEFGTTIQAEEFDHGLDGIAYHDSDPTNTLGSHRSDVGVDSTSTFVGDIADGEWLEYTTEIVGGAYDIGLEVSSDVEDGQIRVLAAKSNSAGYLKELATLDVPNTGGTFSTLWLRGIDLAPAAGTESVIRLEFIGGGFQVDSMQFAAPAQSQYSGLTADRVITADSTTTRIKLIEFDEGGQDVAYYDTTPGNTVGTFRPDEDVDNNGDIITNEVFAGEWLEYTTDIEAGVYDITLGKNWGGPNAGVRLFIGETNSATEFTELGLMIGSDDSLRLNDIDLSPWAGSDRVIRIEIVDNFMGLNYLDFTNTVSDSTAPTADIDDVTPDPRNTHVGVVTINFDEDVTGVDISDLALTRDGVAVDLSGATFAQVSASQYTIDLSAVTSADGTYELRLNSNGSGIQDLAGNALAADASDQFMIDMTGPQVESVVVNDGSAQRSMVSSLTVTFSEEVTGVNADSFVLSNTTTNTVVVPIVTTELIDGKTVATLTFSGPGIIGGSLADGNYTLKTLASAVSDSVGNQLDGNGDGAHGDDATDDFFRLFGDSNGDRSVNIIDLFAFIGDFNKNKREFFDFDGDGNVNIADFFQFRSRFGRSI
ncbi:MAG: Ig-like domain-containing protein, partial [Planctomycetota bacterium]